MSDQQTANTEEAGQAPQEQAGSELSPQVQAIKEALEKYLRPPMNEVGVSVKHRNNIIAYGVNECAQQFEKGVDRIVFAGIHKVKNLVLIETNIKYTSIIYDVIPASKIDAEESLAAAEMACARVHGGPDAQPPAPAQQAAGQEEPKPGPTR